MTNGHARLHSGRSRRRFHRMTRTTVWGSIHLVSCMKETGFSCYGKIEGEVEEANSELLLQEGGIVRRREGGEVGVQGSTLGL